MLVRQILPLVSGFGGTCEETDFFTDGRFNAVRCCNTGLFFDVLPDVEEIQRSLRR